MIRALFKSTIETIIEAEYLDLPVLDKLSECNKLGYPENLIKNLIDNGNTVISRVSSYEGTIFQPYILRINYGIRHDGKIKDELDEFQVYNDILYIPKVKNGVFKDEEGNLTAIGWAMQQRGV